MTERRQGATPRTVLGALIVLAGLAAIVVALDLCLDHYTIEKPTKTSPGNDRSSAVVAVLTPVTAGIVALAGLYFGVSSTGSARGQEAEAKKQEAQARATQATTALVEEAKEAGADPATISRLAR